MTLAAISKTATVCHKEVPLRAVALQRNQSVVTASSRRPSEIAAASFQGVTEKMLEDPRTENQ